MPRIDVVDISHHNTVSSFPALAGAGVIAVIHKATEGTSFVDSRYHERALPALEAGLLWSAYHFLKHGDIEDQMVHFIETAQLPPGSRYMIDYEDPKCTLEDLDEALSVLSHLDTTAQIGIYAGHLLKEQVGSIRYDWLVDYPLWLAQYTSGQPSWPKQIWPYWSLWQYTDKGTVPGVTPPTDLNTFNGDRAQCIAWFEPVSVIEPAPPRPAPAETVVTINIQAPPGVTIALTVNDETKIIGDER